MVGNDIVDLNEARLTSNWQHPRFLDKLFTNTEQYYIQQSPNTFETIWQLWSMKEAAYKLYIQLNPNRFYNPKSFVCSLSGKASFVTYLNFKCCIKTTITSHFILSEARLVASNMTSVFLMFNKKPYAFQSETTYNQLLDKISKDYNVLRSGLKIIKNTWGIPKVYYNSNLLGVTISITHHGNYGAYAVNTCL